MVDRQQAVPHRRVNMKPNQVKVQAKIFSRRSAVARRDESGPVKDPRDDMQVDKPSSESSSISSESASKIMHIVVRPCRPQKMMNTSSLETCAKLNTVSPRLEEYTSELVDLGHVNASQAHELSRLIARDVFALISQDWVKPDQEAVIIGSRWVNDKHDLLDAVNDVPSAFVHARLSEGERHVHVCFLVDTAKLGTLGWLKREHCHWHDGAADVPSTSGGTRMKCNRACFCSPERDCTCWVHGDDFAAEGHGSQL